LVKIVISTGATNMYENLPSARGAEKKKNPITLQLKADP
jgi:hypothetical protein